MYQIDTSIKYRLTMIICTTKLSKFILICSTPQLFIAS